MTIPEDKVKDFAQDYVSDAVNYKYGRADPQDQGTEYRSAIGIPGGMDGPLFAQLKATNDGGKVEFVKGKGNDSDTVGTKKIWIYDSNKFPFHQGEAYHQFHDDMRERYSPAYHKLKVKAVEQGVVKQV